jgi:hypothetical protein
MVDHGGTSLYFLKIIYSEYPIYYSQNSGGFDEGHQTDRIKVRKGVMDQIYYNFRNTKRSSPHVVNPKVRRNTMRICKQHNLACIILTRCFFIAGLVGNSLYAQDPNVYEEIIEPGPPGTINIFIASDTLDGGVHPDSKYILRRDAVYLITDAVKNEGWEMVLVAEEGPGARPLLKPQARPGGAEADYIINGRYNLTLRGLHMNSYDNTFPPPGIPAHAAVARIYTNDSCRVIIDDCILESNKRDGFRAQSWYNTIRFTNCTFKNLYAANDVTDGDCIYIQGDVQDTVAFSNCTFFNSSLFVRGDNTQLNYFKVEHCTIVNLAGVPSNVEPDTLRPELLFESNTWGVLNLGQAYKGVFRNNLLVNTGFAGAYDKPELIPQYIVNLDSTRDVQDTTGVTIVPPEGFDIRNNNIWMDPALVAVYPEFIKPFDQTMFYDPTAQSFIDAGNRAGTLTNLPVTFIDAPRTPLEFVTNWYAQLRGEFEPPLYMPRDQRIIAGPDVEGTLDFSYTDAALLTASTQGQPLGDLRWHDVDMIPTDDEFVTITAVENYESRLPEKFILNQNYPNPFNPTTTITFNLMKKTHVKLAVYNVLGQEIETLVDKDLKPDRYRIHFNAEHLPAGIYFYGLKTDNFVSNKKMVLLK